MAISGQSWTTSADGGYLSHSRLSNKLRHELAPKYKFRQFVEVKEAWGKGKGDTLIFDKMAKIDTAGGTLVEGTTMPENKFTITRGTLTITEYGNGVPYTGKLEILATLGLKSALTSGLMEDAGDTIDNAAAAQFQLADTKYVCTASDSGILTSNGSATATASSAATTGHVRQIIDQLKTMNVKPYDGSGNYVCIASIKFLSGLKSDSNFSTAAAYGQPELFFNGEIARYYGCRFIEDNNVLSNTLGSGAQWGEAVFFGKDSVMEGVAQAVELRSKTPADYGRDKGLGWYFLGGFQKVWDVSTDGQGTMIHATSA